MFWDELMLSDWTPVTLTIELFKLLFWDWLAFKLRDEFVVEFVYWVELGPIEELELLVVSDAVINWEELVAVAFNWV